MVEGGNGRPLGERVEETEIHLPAGRFVETVSLGEPDAREVDTIQEEGLLGAETEAAHESNVGLELDTAEAMREGSPLSSGLM